MAEIEIKTTGANQADAPEYKPPPPSVNLHFDKNHEVQPVGMDGISLNDTVTVVIRGKVTRLEAYGGEYASQAVGIEIKSCRFEQPGASYKKQMSLGEAVDKNRRFIESDADDSGTEE